MCGGGGGGIGGHCDENWTTLLAWVAFVFSLPRVPAVQCRGWLAGSGKRTHLLYEIISDQIQHRMSPVWRDSGGREGGREGLQGGGVRMYCMCKWECGTEVNSSCSRPI